MHYEIRRATKADISGINKLLHQVLKVHNQGRPDLFKPEGQKYTEDKLLQMIEDDDNSIFVCVDGDKVLGHCFCQCQMHEDTSCSYEYKSLYIDDLCVDQNNRGKHIGSELYNYVKQYAKEEGYYNVTLHAWACNPEAVDFYKHLGLDVQQYTMEEIVR